MSTVRYLRHYIPAGVAAPDQIYPYCADEFEATDDIDDTSIFVWYEDHPAPADIPADVVTPYFPIDQEDQLDVEDVYPDYYAQAPPDVFDTPVYPSLEQEEQPEDEPFGFEFVPLPQDPDLVTVEDADDCCVRIDDEREEPEGFVEVPLSPDLVTETGGYSNDDASNQLAEDEDDGVIGFSDDPIPPDGPPPPPPVSTISGGAYPDERARRRKRGSKAPESYEAADTGDYLPPDQFAKQYAAARDRELSKQRPADDDDDAYLRAFLFMMMQDEDEE